MKKRNNFDLSESYRILDATNYIISFKRKKVEKIKIKVYKNMYKE